MTLTLALCVIILVETAAIVGIVWSTLRYLDRQALAGAAERSELLSRIQHPHVYVEPSEKRLDSNYSIDEAPAVDFENDREYWLARGLEID